MESVLLSPDGPFSEIPRSDTLFGAICWGIRDVRGTECLEDVLAQFRADRPPFRISSAFPLLDGDDREYLLATPRLPKLSAGVGKMTDERLEALDVWQQIEYVPASVFSMIATGAVSDSELLAGFDENGAITIGERRYVHDRRFLLPAESDRKPIWRTERTRNAVNRLTGATEGSLYHRDAVFFSDIAGLHVCVEGDVDLVLDGLSVAQDRGIGGDRSVGRGQFRLDGIGSFDLPQPDGDFFCTLSLCIPHPEELEPFLTNGYYEIEPRKGVIENSLTSPDTIWKKRVLALAEGSILPRQTATDRGSERTDGEHSEGPYGYNPIVADHFEHGVQQYGYSLPVGIAPRTASFSAGESE